MRNRAIRWVVVVLVATGLPLLTLQAVATPSGGNSEKQTLLTVDKSSYSVVSIERLGSGTHFQLTNRIALKQYSLSSNQLLYTGVLMESQYNSGFAADPPAPATVLPTDTQLTTLQTTLGERVGWFAGYIRSPKHKITAASEGISMHKNGNRTILLTVKQLESRIPDYLQLLNYDAIEVIGMQGSARSHYFIVVRSNEWASDAGSFEYVIAVPNQ